MKKRWLSCCFQEGMHARDCPNSTRRKDFFGAPAEKESRAVMLVCSRCRRYRPAADEVAALDAAKDPCGRCGGRMSFIKKRP